MPEPHSQLPSAATLTLKLDQRNTELGTIRHARLNPFPSPRGWGCPLPPPPFLQPFFSPPSWVAAPLKQPCEHSPRLDVSAPAYISYRPLSSPASPDTAGTDGQLSTDITSRAGKGWMWEKMPGWRPSAPDPSWGKKKGGLVVGDSGSERLGVVTIQNCILGWEPAERKCGNDGNTRRW